MTPAEAEKEILQAFFVEWKLNAPSAVGGRTPPEVRWEDVEYPDPPDPDKAWARAVVIHADGDQASLSDEHGARRWANYGTVIVQCFAPFKASGKKGALDLATVVRDAFRGARTANGIVFTRARVKDVGPDKSWWQVNAVAEFSYDEVN